MSMVNRRLWAAFARHRAQFISRIGHVPLGKVSSFRPSSFNIRTFMRNGEVALARRKAARKEQSTCSSDHARSACRSFNPSACTFRGRFLFVMAAAIGVLAPGLANLCAAQCSALGEVVRERTTWSVCVIQAAQEVASSDPQPPSSCPQIACPPETETRINCSETPENGVMPVGSPCVAPCGFNSYGGPLGPEIIAGDATCDRPGDVMIRIGAACGGTERWSEPFPADQSRVFNACFSGVEGRVRYIPPPPDAQECQDAIEDAILAILFEDGVCDGPITPQEVIDNLEGS